MPDFDQIEKVLRRYQFNSYPDIITLYIRACKATKVLQDAGYTVDCRVVYFNQDKTSARNEYYVEIDGRVTHAGIDRAALIGFAHDLCNDYRDRDMAALVEYVKAKLEPLGELKEFKPVDNKVMGEFIEAMQDLNDWRNLENDFDSTQDDVCGCAERMQSLSERVERLERDGKCKDVDSDGTPYGLPQGKPYWAIPPQENPYSPFVTTGSGSVTISPIDGLRISQDPDIGYHVGKFADGTTFQVSDNVNWHTSVGTGKVLIERDVIVAEISRRAEKWRMHATAAEVDGKLQKAKRYEATAHVLQCLADDITSGVLDNE